MSLFKTRDWWSVPRDATEEGDEECINSSLLVSNITNDSSGQNKIVVGGFSGNLRIYAPQTTPQDEGPDAYGYKADHLLLEIAIGIPILQLAAGKFVSGNSNLHLCLLHSDHFVVYLVSFIKGQGGHGGQVKLNKVYQHNFPRKAFSLTSGNFGSVKGKDFLAVQSLDGCVSFYEQESLGFSCFLPSFLLPGPLAYLPKSDTLVTQGSDWTLQSYKYQTLSVLGQDAGNENIKTGGKRIQPEWTQAMSEAVLDINILVEPGNVSSILLLMCHSFVCYKDSGILKFSKKLEYNPSCFTAFHNDKTIHVCVASCTNNLLIYKETDLKWATQLPFVPVAIQRANFKGIEGGIVLLGESGELQVCYLGTDPSLFAAPPVESREINYEETDREMALLNRIIRSSTKDTGSLANLSRTDKDMSVTVTVGSQLEGWMGTTKVNDPDGIPCATLVIRLKASTPLTTVRVNIQTEKPIGVSQTTYVLGTVCDTCQILVQCYLADSYIPSSLIVKVIASYLSHTGAPHVNSTDVKLPLKLVAKPSSPNKEADHKITISTNKPAVNLTELFPEFCGENTVSTALGLQYYGGCNVTVLSSRTTNRYRLQSDSLASLWVVMSSVIERLETYWSLERKGQEEKLTMGITSPLPLPDLYSEIDAHFLRRQKHKDLESQLVDRAVQFRAVQRRLLTKFKDKTPTPLTNLDNLLDGTYKQILKLTETIDHNRKGLEEDGCQLSCIVRLILELLCLQTGISLEHKEILSAALSPIVYPNMDQGWEELVDCSVTFVLRTIMGKGNRDMGSYAQNLAMPSDTSKLKKHIGLLVDKLIKGGADLSDLCPKSNAPRKDTSRMEKEKSDSEDVLKTVLEKSTDVPLGSRLGVDRARSARIRSARLVSAKSTRKLSALSKEESVDSVASDDYPDADYETIAEERSSSPADETIAENFSEDKFSPNSPVYEEIKENIYSEIEENTKIPDEIAVDPVGNQNPTENEEMEAEESKTPEDPTTIQEMETEESKTSEDPTTIQETEDATNVQEALNDSNIEDESSKAEILNKDESLKKSLTAKDNLIEAPEDIFGNPIDDDDAW